MRKLATALTLSLCLGCGAAGYQPDQAPPVNIAPCDEINPCGGSGSPIVMGVAMAALVGITVVIGRLSQ